jgi:hypothetical protein
MSILVDDFEFKNALLRRFSLVAAGVPVNLTGCTARMKLKYKPTTSSRAALELTTANGKIVLGGTPFNIVVDAPDTSTLQVGPYDYDFELLDSLGKVRNLWTGTATKLHSTLAP